MQKLALVIAVSLVVFGGSVAFASEEGRQAPEGPAVDRQDVGMQKDVQAQTKADVARGAVEPAARAGDVSRQPEKANLTLKDKIAPMLKKGLPDGRDENTFSGGVSAGTSDQKANNPRVKGAQGNVTDRMKKAMLTVQLLLRRGKGGEANEGFSNASIQRVKNAVDDATADQDKGRPNAQESLQQGIMKVQLLMKRGKGSVADEGFSDNSIRSVNKAMSGSKGDRSRQESVQEKAFQHTRAERRQGLLQLEVQGVITGWR